MRSGLQCRQTFPYEMYQFWWMMDADVVRFLKIFHFLSSDDWRDPQNSLRPLMNAWFKDLGVKLSSCPSVWKEASKPSTSQNNPCRKHQNLSVKELKQGLRGAKPLWSKQKDQPQQYCWTLGHSWKRGKFKTPPPRRCSKWSYLRQRRTIQDLDYVLSW